MWTQAVWTASGIVVGAVLAAFAVVTLTWLAFKSVVERLDERRQTRHKVANPNAKTLSEIQAEILAEIDKANRAETERLSMETAIRHDREVDAELEAAPTETFARVPAEVDAVPSPRPPLLSRPYLDQRAVVDRAGMR